MVASKPKRTAISDGVRALERREMRSFPCAFRDEIGRVAREWLDLSDKISVARKWLGFGDKVARKSGYTPQRGVIVIPIPKEHG